MPVVIVVNLEFTAHFVAIRGKNLSINSPVPVILGIGLPGNDIIAIIEDSNIGLYLMSIGIAVDLNGITELVALTIKALNKGIAIVVIVKTIPSDNKSTII